MSDISEYFEDIVKEFNEPSLVASWILTETMRRLKEHEIEVEDIKMSNSNFVKLLGLIKSEKVSNNSANISNTTRHGRMIIAQNSLTNEHKYYKTWSHDNSSK